MAGEPTLLLRAHQIQEALSGIIDLNFIAEIGNEDAEKLKNLRTRLCEFLEVSQKFLLTNDIPFPKDGEKIDIIPEACNLPAEICYFEREHPIHKIVVAVIAFKVPYEVAELEIEEKIDIKFGAAILFKYPGKDVWNLSPYFSFAGLCKETGRVKVSSSVVVSCSVPSEIKQGLSLASMAASSEILYFLQLLSCSNVTMKTIVRPEKLNKKRKEKKLPLIDDFHILKLPLSEKVRYEGKEESERSSPRLHFRRGHIRRLSENHLTWVSHCLVGDAGLGTVSKTYQL